MKKIFLILISLSFFNNLVKAGDTTIVRIHDHTDMTWYGNYDEWGVLPDSTKQYRKVYMHYTMGCPISGCAPYDYTTKIEVRHRTGKLDSTLENSPTFTINGSIIDSIYFSYSPIYIYSWDSINNSLDSTTSQNLTILLFNDSTSPLVATDTLNVFLSNINTFNFDSLGNIIDSTFIYADTSMILEYYNWYSYYEVIENYELARVITPYGGNIPSSYSFTQTFDITDFIQILRDSVEIRCHYSGWGNGWSATLDFEFIEGTPPRNIVSLKNIYSGNYNYVNSADFESNKLIPKNFLINSTSDQAMIKMTTTGHGFDNNIYAAEFKPIDYYVYIDGVLRDSEYNWNPDCGENPIYPYYETSSSYIHTWILDRANWCPGLKAKSFDHEITPYITPGDSIEIDVNFQSYSWSGAQTPSYIIDCQLFQYKNTNFNNSVEILDIIKPSLKDEWSRKNPICGKPLIKIRNYGSNPLTSLEIDYKVTGGNLHTYNWSGNLSFLETEEIELPNLSSWAGSKNTFEVTLRNPNGQPDDYNENNSMLSEFEIVPEYPETFALWIGTNNGVVNSQNQQSETSWNIYDKDGNTVYTSGPLYANTQYRDTLTLESGCYTLIVEDTDEDGLDYGYNSDGTGMIRFREIGGGWLKIFNPKFGTNIIHQFTVGGSQNQENILNHNWEIFPNPTKEHITITGFTKEKTKIIIVNNLAKEIMSKEVKSGHVSEVVDLKHLSSGVYFVKIMNLNKIITKKIIKQ